MTTNGAFAPTTPRSVPNTAAAAIAASSAATFAGQAGPPGAAASHAGRGADAVTSLQPFAAMPASSAASGLSGIMRGLSGFSGMGAPDGVMPAGGTNAALILQGEITLDGRQLGRLTAKAQGRELARGQLGSRTVNLRKVAVPSGSLPPLP